MRDPEPGVPIGTALAFLDLAAEAVVDIRLAQDWADKHTAVAIVFDDANSTDLVEQWLGECTSSMRTVQSELSGLVRYLQDMLRELDRYKGCFSWPTDLDVAEFCRKLVAEGSLPDLAIIADIAGDLGSGDFASMCLRLESIATLLLQQAEALEATSSGLTGVPTGKLHYAVVASDEGIMSPRAQSMRIGVRLGVLSAGVLCAQAIVTEWEQRAIKAR